MTAARVAAAAWTPAEDLELRALWDEGLTASQIAERMRRPRNSIIGRAHRLKLPPRPSPIKPRSDGAPIVRRRRIRQDSKAALVSAQQICTAEAFRRHGALASSVSSLGAAGHPIPAQAGDSSRPAAGGTTQQPCVAGVSSPTPHVGAPAPSPVSTPATAAFSAGCRWPMWGDRERATHVFCEAPQRVKRDGTRCSYCAKHAAIAFTVAAAEADKRAEKFKLRRSVGGWVAA